MNYENNLMRNYLLENFEPKMSTYTKNKLFIISNFYYFFITILLISNTVVMIFVLFYIQEINNNASILSNTTLINSMDKLEKMIDLICKNIITGC